SYLHCEWRTANEIGDPRFAQKVKRHKQAKLAAGKCVLLTPSSSTSSLQMQQAPATGAEQQQEDEDLFNPDYIEADRVLDCQTVNDCTYYLVKWRSLPYDDATWERTEDVPSAKIKEYNRNSQPPSETERRHRTARPDDPDAWLGRQIEAGRVYKGGNQLRDYQLEGVNWLTYCWYHGRNCILADEMGLGKTVQSITFLKEVFDYGIKGPFLVIVPLSTIGNWQREFENWTDMNVVVYHGSTASRLMLQQYEIHHRDSKEKIIKHCYKFNALITTYEILMTDIEFFGQIEWRVSVIDEAHRLKNKKCKLGEGLRYLRLEHRVLLTGTPLQNNVEELFSLLNFLEPESFPCSQAFLAEFGDLKTESQVDNLKATLKPMMLRRLKEDVEKSIAPKEETIIEVELTNIQKKYYRAILERNFAFLSKGATSSNTPNLMNTMMELRKCCNHPFLIKGAEDNIMSELRHQYQDMDSQEYQFQALVYASGKLVLVHKLLPKLLQGGHKVLMFSQMVRVLDIIEDFLIHMQYQYERIDGRIHGLQRQEAIDRFSNDPNKFVFLLCTKAGGLGINLTAADTVIIYDSDWNPQNDLQAQARCHRIGQEKSVKVY
uniref:DNA helicase n=1 Tax=Macrostomum lignano TaxID=282301 RepID=A0A1I8G5A8_9PLAT